MYVRCNYYVAYGTTRASIYTEFVSEVANSIIIFLVSKSPIVMNIWLYYACVKILFTCSTISYARAQQ